jgi:membrane protein implicated in regulation of membrane protease activity
MLRIPSRYTHFVYGIIQSGVTCAIAGAIASFPALKEGDFLKHWLTSWALSWMTMLPVVVLAAPLIRRLVERMTGSASAAKRRVHTL